MHVNFFDSSVITTLQLLEKYNNKSDMLFEPIEISVLLYIPTEVELN